MRTFARSAFFVSGIAGLGLEIVWTRYLGLALGATTLAVASTTAAYMGGMALGAWAAGRVADRTRRPLAWYGGLELLVAALALAVPTACHALPALQSWAGSAGAGPTAAAMLRFALAVAVLLLPTAAMGATLPVLARAVVTDARHVGREVGMLYAANTLGAMLGAGVCGFWAIPTLGLAATHAAAAGLDAALGALALAIGLRCGPLAATQSAGDVDAAKAVATPDAPLIIALFGVTGAAAMALQVLWTRALGTALGPSTYAFTAVVCVYLGGLALGAAAAARLAARARHIRLTLVGALLAAGTFALVGIAQVDRLPGLLRHIVLDEHLTMAALLRGEMALAALSILPATVAMGALFPLALAALAPGRGEQGTGAHAGRSDAHSEHRIAARRDAESVGQAYAVNTGGAIIGCFLAVFALLPLAGVEGGMRVAAAAYVIAAAALCVRLEITVPRAQRLLALALAGALGSALVAWPRWDVRAWTAGMYRMSMTRAYFHDAATPNARLVFHEDGLASTVTVEQEDDVRWIKVNGKIDGSSQGDMPTQVLSGLLPVLLRPDAREVAVIGCGSCVTLGAVLQGHAQQVTLVELEPAVVRAAHLFDDVNHAPWQDVRLQVVADDGRSYLGARTRPLDVIVSEPSNPWMAGASSLFTREFFALARDRLAADGVFVQWLQIYELAPQRIAALLKTFHQEFPHVLVFSAHPESNDLLLVGSTQPLHAAMAQLEAGFTAHAGELARAELHAPEELLALLLFDAAHIDTLPANVPLNTDDNALIEFGAPQDLLTFAEDDPEMPWLAAPEGHRAAAVARLLNAPAQWPEHVARLAEGYLTQGMLVDARAAADAAAPIASSDGRTRAAQVAAAADLLAAPDDQERVVELGAPTQVPEYAEAVRLYVAGQLDAALASLEAHPALVRGSGPHQLFYGYLLYRQQQFGAARRTLLRARAAADDAALQPRIDYYLARNAYREGDYRQAVRDILAYRGARAADPTRHTED